MNIFNFPGVSEANFGIRTHLSESSWGRRSGTTPRRPRTATPSSIARTWRGRGAAGGSPGARTETRARYGTLDGRVPHRACSSAAPPSARTWDCCWRPTVTRSKCTTGAPTAWCPLFSADFGRETVSYEHRAVPTEGLCW